MDNILHNEERAIILDWIPLDIHKQLRYVNTTYYGLSKYCKYKIKKYDFNSYIKPQKEITLKDILNNLNLLKFVTDEEVILAAVRQNGLALGYIPEHLMTNEILLAAVRKNGYALQYVSEHLMTNEVVLTAVRQNGCVLQYVPERLQTPEVVLAAVSQDGWALRYVKKMNLELLMKIIQYFKDHNITSYDKLIKKWVRELK